MHWIATPIRNGPQILSRSKSFNAPFYDKGTEKKPHRVRQRPEVPEMPRATVNNPHEVQMAL